MVRKKSGKMELQILLCFVVMDATGVGVVAVLVTIYNKSDKIGTFLVDSEPTEC